jgi:hypothetical protein
MGRADWIGFPWHEELGGRGHEPLLTVAAEGALRLPLSARSFITRGLSRDGTPGKSGKFRVTPGPASKAGPSQIPCKQAELEQYDRLDRTQEVAGSSPASSTRRTPATAGVLSF